MPSQDANIPRELERAGALCVAFANTEAPQPDRRFNDADHGPAYRFEEYAELSAWARRMGILTTAEAELLDREASASPRDAAAALGRVRELRSSLIRLFTGLVLGREPRPEDLERLNAALTVKRIVPSSDPLEFRLEMGGEPLALERVAAAVAHSATELLTSSRVKRLRQCAAEGCRRLFVHRSSRRLWCDMNTCGSRLKARRRSRR